MSVDGEWLSLNREPAIEPELKIIDPHHHFWDRPGFRYMLDDFLADIADGHNIVGSVFVEGGSRQQVGGSMYRADGPEELRSLGETEFVDDLAAVARTGRHGPAGLCAGIVSYVDLRLGEAVKPVLARHAQMPRVRGVRNMTAWHADPAIRNRDLDTTPGMLDEPAFRKGFAALEEFGFSFDALVFVPQIPELVGLSRAFPGVRIVLDHLGGVMGAGSYAGRRNEAFLEWRAHLAELARCPNVHVKIGGLSSPRGGFGLDGRARPAQSDELAGHWRPYVETCIELFGAERCMFESNFPIDKQWVTYASVWNAFKIITRNCSASERHALFFQTAGDFYRLDLPGAKP